MERSRFVIVYQVRADARTGRPFTGRRGARQLQERGGVLWVASHPPFGEGMCDKSSSPASFGLKAGEVELVSPEFRNISPRRARVLAVTAVLFMIFLLTRRSGLDPDHAAADTARAGTAHTAATTLTIVLAVAFLSGLGDGDPRGSLTRN
jgi:hypothetical protein